jgi:hypothetical protein
LTCYVTYKLPKKHNTFRRTRRTKSAGEESFDSSFFGGICQSNFRPSSEGYKTADDYILTGESLDEFIVVVFEVDRDNGYALVLDLLDFGFVDGSRSHKCSQFL